ncbi:unnamed protein product [Mucor fragilis]
MLNDDTRKPKNGMPRLFMNDLRNTKTQIKLWWRQFKKNSESSSVDDSSSHTTLDWRSLSPDRPPLPFFLSDNSSNSSTTSVHNDNLIDKKPISSIPALLADTTLIDPSIDSNSKNTKENSNNSISKSSPASNSRNNTIDNYQPLCPILEESETMATESNESNVLLNSNSQIQQHSPSQASHAATDSSSSIQLDHPDNKQTVSSAVVAASSVQEPSADQQQQPETLTSAAPAPTTLTAATPSTSSSIDADANKPWPEIKAVQKTPSDRYMPLDLVGNEELCKRKFAKMVLAANKFQNQQQRAQEQDERPSQMALLFDVDGNIDMMRMVRQGKSEYHKFCGNSQYVPPELSVNVDYQSELADIWVLGIFLYRMLVGKYPFSAANDQQLFKKMLHSDFSIPNELSDDAKDIIKRMLAPDSSRASLDLIIYHPWIKSYRPLLLDHYHNSNNHNNNHTGNTMKANRPIFINNNNNTTTSKRPPLSNIQQKKRSILSGRSIRRTNSVNTTTPSSSTSSTQEPKPKKAKPNTKQKGFIKKAFLLLLQGPFPPPKKPYQDLAHLGTRESVFAKHRM